MGIVCFIVVYVKRFKEVTDVQLHAVAISAMPVICFVSVSLLIFVTVIMELGSA
jgi:hypothetical protein